MSMRIQLQALVALAFFVCSTEQRTNAASSKVNDDAGAETELRGAQAELHALETKIDAEREMWKQSLAVINNLTNNKRTPVTQGSTQYYQCLEASKIISDVEKEAPKLNAERERLIGRVKSLEAQHTSTSDRESSHSASSTEPTPIELNVAHADPAQPATSIVIFRSRSDQADEFANAMLFQRRETFGAVSHFYPPHSNTPQILENGSIASANVLDDVIKHNVLGAGDSETLEQKDQELKNLVAKFPRSRSLLKPFLDAIENAIAQIKNGNTFYNGTWITQVAYDSMMEARKQEVLDREAAIALKAKMAKEKQEADIAKSAALIEDKTRERVKEVVNQLVKYLDESRTRGNNAETKDSPVNQVATILVSFQLKDVDGARNLISDAQFLKQKGGNASEIARRSEDVLTALIATSEAAGEWQKEDGGRAVAILRRSPLPTLGDQSEYGDFWRMFLELKTSSETLENREKEEERQFVLALSEHKTSEAIVALTKALALIPNAELKKRLVDLKKNSLGL